MTKKLHYFFLITENQINTNSKRGTALNGQSLYTKIKPPTPSLSTLLTLT